MNMNRTMLFAALLAAGIATGATAQTPSPGTPAPSGKASTPATQAVPATPQAAPATPAPPSTGSTGMDKGAGTGDKATPSKAAAGSSALARSERRFIEKATQGGMEEVELSKLAMDKAQNAQVKEFAKRVVDDHAKANAELAKLASAKGVSAPATLDGGHKRKVERMAKKSGADFDRDYMDDMVDDHQKDVREFRSMAKSAKDPDLKAFAASTLPTLEQHLQLAKTTEAAVKKSGRDTKASTAGSTTTTTRTAAPSGTTGGGPTGTAKSTATPGKDTAATTGTAGPGTGMPASSTQSTGTAPQPPGSASDTKTTSPAK